MNKEISKKSIGLPEGWQWRRFSEFAVLKHGYQFRNFDFVETGIPVVKIGQCKSDGKLDLSGCDYISDAREKEFEDIRIYKGDLLMALTGGTLGKVTWVDKDYGVIVQNYRVGNFYPKEGKSIKRFLMYVLTSDFFQNLIKDKVNQGAQPNIGKEHIENMLVPLPPLPEQQVIVQKLDVLFSRIDKAICLIEENLEHLQHLLPTALNEVFGEGRRNGWVTKKLGEVAKVIGGGTPTKQNKSYYDNGNILWASVRDMNVESLEDTELKITPTAIRESATNIIPAGNLVIATRVGLGKVCKLKYDTAINQDLKGIVPSEEVIVNFLFYWFKSISKYIEEKGTGATVKGVKVDFVNNLNFSFPDRFTQQGIARYLNALTRKQQVLQDRYTNQLHKLKALKKSLLNAAFKGELIQQNIMASY
ncbi:restriction endonuclease subunit S [Paraflavisolibacter sp. H34]|uniref:restriction endonuclease subunit S n=1 Tax=Huijunlia imazamoxiresistens TaxID=3127457 RepID=UPI003018020B